MTDDSTVHDGYVRSTSSTTLQHFTNTLHATLTFNMSKKLFGIFNKINNKTNETPIEDSVVHKNEKLGDDCSITFNVNLSVTDNETKRNTSNFELDNLDLGTIISGPVQPILKKYPTTKFGDQNRAFSASYFAKFDWLEYSIINDKLMLCLPQL
ncbi:unnamed protein product [Macrosiphum euphorbiae]|uniref:Uncharacterized protein n=1 Tax=Macrosiphum euphorbiae TaxID=13131 RepID=A0AAV0Y551_9HEMI|nr:unnamed protein product [Macrosiphum euphorbiae]